MNFEDCKACKRQKSFFVCLLSREMLNPEGKHEISRTVGVDKTENVESFSLLLSFCTIAIDALDLP
jgi:hypothetical protein